MSEICPDCLNKITGKNGSKWKYILSRDLDLCEECGERKRVVIVERWVFYRRIFGIFLLPFYILYFLWRLILLPYLIIKYRKNRKKKTGSVLQEQYETLFLEFAKNANAK